MERGWIELLRQWDFFLFAIDIGFQSGMVIEWRKLSEWMIFEKKFFEEKRWRGNYRDRQLLLFRMIDRFIESLLHWIGIYLHSMELFSQHNLYWFFEIYIQNLRNGKMCFLLIKMKIHAKRRECMFNEEMKAFTLPI